MLSELVSVFSMTRFPVLLGGVSGTALLSGLLGGCHLMKSKIERRFCKKGQNFTIRGTGALLGVGVYGIGVYIVMLDV